MTGRRVVVQGLVQGVGFRWACRQEAVRLGLSGWVRNRRDGSVEAVVHGDAAAVRTFLDWVAVGPPGARVEAVHDEAVHDEPVHDESIHHARDHGETVHVETDERVAAARFEIRT